MVEFGPWARHDNFKPFHKFDKGLLDVRVKGSSLEELREQIHACEAQARCPKGWKVALQSTSKCPVLRYRVGVILGDLSANAFDTARPILVEALNALSGLKSWREQDGARQLVMSP
jgi:hypothetical protein